MGPVRVAGESIFGAVGLPGSKSVVALLTGLFGCSRMPNATQDCSSPHELGGRAVLCLISLGDRTSNDTRHANSANRLPSSDASITSPWIGQDCATTLRKQWRRPG